VVEVRDRLRLGAGAVDLGVDEQLRRRLAVALDHLSVEVDDEQPVGVEERADVVRLLDEEGVASGQAGADMAAVVEDVLGDEEPAAGGDVAAQGLFGDACGWDGRHGLTFAAQRAMINGLSIIPIYRIYVTTSASMSTCGEGTVPP